MNFQKKVIIVATIILIGLLVFVGYAIQKDKGEATFPPVTAECPDYWDSVNNECVNTKSLGSCNLDDSPKNFDVDIYKGNDGPYEKYKWAKNCKTSWDGITNMPNICKDSS